MSSSCSNESSGYSPSSIVNIFHSIPHVDIDLGESSSQFEVSLDYFQAIVIWGCVPILACICIFILMTVYYICVCCCCCCAEKKPRPKSVKCGCCFLITLLIVFCLGLIGAGLYSEIALNSDIMSFVSDGGKINNDILKISSEVNSYNATEVGIALNNVISGIKETNVSNTSKAISDARELEAANDVIMEYLSSSLSSSLSGLDYSSAINDADYYEDIRHWSVLGYLIFVAVILLIVFLVMIFMTPVGISIMLVLLGIVTFTVWVACGGSFSLVILLSDICSDPDTIARNLTDDSQARALIDYYIVCTEDCFPFDEEREKANLSIRSATSLIDQLAGFVNNFTDSDTKMSFAEVRGGINRADKVYTNISSTLRCLRSQGIHEYYRSALDSACSHRNGYVYALILFCLFTMLAVSLVVLMCCLTCLAGIIASTLNEDEIDEDIVAYDTPRAASSFNNRRGSYSEPYSNGGDIAYQPDQFRTSGVTRTASMDPPKYTDIGRPTSGEYDHFDT